MEYKIKELAFANLFQDEITPLENVCTMMGLHGFCLVNNHSTSSEEDEHILLHRFVNPEYTNTSLPDENEILRSIRGEINGSERNISTPICIDIEDHDNTSNSFHLAVFVPKNDLIADLIVIFCKSGNTFKKEELAGLQTNVELACVSMGQKKTIEALENEKIKYRHLFSASPEAIVMLDKNNYILDANPEFSRLFQYSREQYLGKEIDVLLAPGALNEEAVLLSQSNWNGLEVSVETQRQRRDGTLCDVLVMGVPFYHADGQLRVFGIYRDISERVKNEKQRQSRIAFIEYISHLSSELINLDILALDDVIESALMKVARMHSAERAYIVRSSQGEERVTMTHEWTQDARFSHIARQLNINRSEVSEFFTRLQSGETFYLQRSEVGQIPGTNELELYFDLLDIETLVTIPLFSEKTFLGYIGFDSYSRPLRWDEQSLNAFALTGQIIANALTRKKTELELKEAIIKAEASDKLKSAFLAGISHEIRTPMNHIIGFIDIMNEPDITSAEKTEYLGIMKNSGMHLLRLIDDVIELAMIDSGQLSYKENACDLCRFMESLVVETEGVKADMNRSSVILNFNIPDQYRNMIVLTDEIKLRQILWNLLINALKYTETGHVDFGFEMGSEKISFFVKDTGIGIDPQFHTAIFERFHRIENGFSRQYGGAGLGLPISQGLVALFNDKISVESKPGVGTTFSFSIPYIPYKSGLNGHTIKTSVTATVNWGGKTILMVEDDPVNMRFLTVLLLRTHAELLYASNGVEALEIVKNQPVDLVLMDMQLPVMDGHEATRLIKQIRPQLPVIAQTAHALSNDRIACLESGCDDYLSKPINKNVLYQVLDKLMS